MPISFPRPLIIHSAKRLGPPPNPELLHLLKSEVEPLLKYCKSDPLTPERIQMAQKLDAALEKAGLPKIGDKGFTEYMQAQFELARAFNQITAQSSDQCSIDYLTRWESSIKDELNDPIGRSYEGLLIERTHHAPPNDHLDIFSPLICRITISYLGKKSKMLVSADTPKYIGGYATAESTFIYHRHFKPKLNSPKEIWWKLSAPLYRESSMCLDYFKTLAHSDMARIYRASGYGPTGFTGHAIHEKRHLLDHGIDGCWYQTSHSKVQSVYQLEPFLIIHPYTIRETTAMLATIIDIPKIKYGLYTPNTYSESEWPHTPAVALYNLLLLAFMSKENPFSFSARAKDRLEIIRQTEDRAKSAHSGSESKYDPNLAEKYYRLLFESPKQTIEMIQEVNHWAKKDEQLVRRAAYDAQRFVYRAYYGIIDSNVI